MQFYILHVGIIVRLLDFEQYEVMTPIYEAKKATPLFMKSANCTSYVFH